MEAKKFSKCPNCGSTRRLFEEQTKLLHEKSTVPTGINFYYESKNQLLGNKQVAEHQLIGSKLPTIATISDVCMDCGTIYIVEYRIDEATKSLVPQRPRIVGPGMLGG